MPILESPEIEDLCKSYFYLISALYKLFNDYSDRLLAWADDSLKVKGLIEIELLGVAGLEKILDSRIRHGTEITGATFFRKQPWSKNQDLIPAKSALKAFMFEDNAHKPFGEILEKVRGKAFVNRCKKLYEERNS